MSVDVAGNQLLHKGANRMAIVRRLCARPGMSRSDLATALGLTRSSVTLLVRELLSEGWLAESEVVTMVAMPPAAPSSSRRVRPARRSPIT